MLISKRTKAKSRYADLAAHDYFKRLDAAALKDIRAIYHPSFGEIAAMCAVVLFVGFFGAWAYATELEYLQTVSVYQVAGR